MTLQEGLLSIISNKWLLLLMSLGSLLFSGFGYYLNFSSTLNKSNVTLLSSTSSPELTLGLDTPSILEESRIGVYASGAVNKPGIYFLSSSSRIADLVKSAGGLSSGIDISFIGSTLNMAAKLTDAQHIHFPWSGEVVFDAAVSPSKITTATPVTTDSESSSDSKVNINLCTRNELLDIKGIGATYADKIIKARPIKSFDELISETKLPKNLVEYLSNNTII
jgi:competence protein ComEA